MEVKKNPKADLQNYTKSFILLGLVLALFIPTFAIIVFVGIMGFESDYTQLGRKVFFDTGKPATVYAVPHSEVHKESHSEKGDH